MFWNRAKKISDYDLSNKYYIADTAKDDYDKKVKFIREQVIGNTNKWAGEIQKEEKLLEKQRIKINRKVVEIVDFVLMEFFGTLALKKEGTQRFIELKSHSKHHFSENLHDADISLTDLPTTSHETIGTNVFKSMESTLKNGSYKELAKRGEWIKSDKKWLAAELGIGVGIEVFKGVVDKVGENVEIIKRVRAADQRLPSIISQIGKEMHFLAISESEVEKRENFFKNRK